MGLPFIMRHLETETVIGGIKIPAGITVSQCKYPFEKTKFDPFQWKNFEEVDKVAMPFGIGKRKCVGYRLAELMCCTFLAQFLKKFTVFNAGGEPNQNVQITNE